MKVTLKPQRGITNKGLCYFCSNFKKDPRGGMVGDYALSNVAVRTASTTTALLGLITQFVEKKDAYGTESTIFGKSGSGGHLTATDLASNAFFRTSEYSKTVGFARGLAMDTEGELIYTGNQYLGRTSSSTLDGALAASASPAVIDVIDASGFPAAGYCFIKDGVEDSETIQYTGKSTNQLTGVTRGKFFSTDGTHGTGRDIIAFDDDWQDLGAVEATDIRPIIKFGDYNLIGNVNKIAGWKETNFSDWSTGLVSFPSPYSVVDFSILHYGSEPMVMVAANNKEESGMLFFCTRDDIANGEYTRYVPVNERIQKIHKNLIGTKSGIYQTDGYILTPVASLPDDYKEIRSADFDIYDIKSKENFLLITANCNQRDRNRTGLWILDLEDKSWYYVLPSNYGTYNQNFGAMFISSDWAILVSHDYNSGAVDKLRTQAAARGNYYQLIYQPPDSKTYKLQTVNLNLYTKLKTEFNDTDYDFDIIVRYYDFKRPFLQRSKIAAVSSTSQLIISETAGTYGKPVVGDRVEVIERNNSAQADIAAAPRNVTAVSTAGGKHTLTLDDDLPDTPTADDQFVLINPLIKIKKISISGSEINPEDLRIPVPDMPEFKKLMIEVEIRYTETGTSVGLASLDLEFTPK